MSKEISMEAIIFFSDPQKVEHRGNFSKDDANRRLFMGFLPEKMSENSYKNFIDINGTCRRGARWHCTSCLFQHHRLMKSDSG